MKKKKAGKKETFVLVSLEEAQAKKLATVLTNDTCRKILDYLAAHEDATETAIAKDLGIATSTVHYNIQALLSGGLVEVEEFHYSKKGREVNHYRLANKYIVIAPKKSPNLTSVLKRILPVGLIMAAAAGAIQLFSPSSTSQPKIAMAEMAIDTGLRAGAEAAPVVIHEPSIALWFFIGALASLVLYVLCELWRK